MIGADPILAVIEGLQFSVKMRDSSLTRRGFRWWAVIVGLCSAGVPVMEVTPQQIKQFATGKGNASKSEMVAAYAKAWPDAPLGRNVEDRADAAHSAALGAAWVGVEGLPQSLTVVRQKLIAKLPPPTLPPRAGCRWRRAHEPTLRHLRRILGRAPRPPRGGLALRGRQRRHRLDYWEWIENRVRVR